MSKPSAQLIVALDVDTLEEVRQLVDNLSGCVDIFKVGSQLFTACGPVAVRFIQARGKKVFLDLKYHDIPNTVASAVKSAIHISVPMDSNMDYSKQKTVAERGIFMLTLHTVGGLEMMKMAAETALKESQAANLPEPLLVGVTVLTSDENKNNVQGTVLERALLAKQAGLDGVVSSCHEAKMIRKELGPDFIIVTPGIRPAGTDAQDQQRIATTAGAMESGSNFLVVGRPIVQAKNPLAAAQEILKEMNAA